MNIRNFVFIASLLLTINIFSIAANASDALEILEIDGSEIKVRFNNEEFFIRPIALKASQSTDGATQETQEQEKKEHVEEYPEEPEFSPKVLPSVHLEGSYDTGKYGSLGLMIFKEKLPARPNGESIPFFRVDFGAGPRMGRASVGIGRLKFIDMEGDDRKVDPFPISVNAVYMRTWRLNKDRINEMGEATDDYYLLPGQHFIGGEFELKWWVFFKFGIGAYKRVAGSQPGKNTVVVMKLGMGLF
jgi:hypothetical protein